MAARLAGVAWTVRPSAAPAVGEAPAVEVAGFSFVAEAASVTVYHAERYLAKDLPDPEPTSFTTADVSASGGTGDGDAARILVLPTPGSGASLNVSDHGLRLTAVGTGAWPYPPRVNGTPSADLDTGQAIQVDTLGDGLVQLTGSLRLVIDGVDLQLFSSEGADTVHTRADVDEGAQVNAGRTSYAAHSFVHEAVIDLFGARLVMPASEVHVQSATLSGADWSLSDAAGTFAGHPVDARSVVLQGGLRADLHRVPGQRLEARFDGEVAAMTLDGHPVAVPQPPAGGSPPWTALALGITAACLPIAAHASLGRWRFGRLDAAMDRKEYGRALHLAGAFRGHTALAQDAALAAAICLLSLGRAQEAAERLAAQPRWAMQRRPTRDFLLARAAAAVGQRHEATRLLAGSLLADPVLVAQARADPLLAGLLRPLGATPAGEAYA
ncbi:MAG: hypothetical protein QOJ26_77 [Thermoplasmata archaeon]|nr:hypothetical protein [Thermoplasmata archaeon]